MTKPTKEKGPRRTETRIAGAIRFAREHPDQCDDFLEALDDSLMAGAATRAERQCELAEEQHRITMARVRRVRDFAREVQGLPTDLLEVVRGAVRAVKTTHVARAASCVVPTEQPPADDVGDAVPTTVAP